MREKRKNKKNKEVKDEKYKSEKKTIYTKLNQNYILIALSEVISNVLKRDMQCKKALLTTRSLDTETQHNRAVMLDQN